MSELRPVFVVGPPGPGREAAERGLPDDLDLRVCDGVERLLEELPPPVEEEPGATGVRGVIVITEMPDASALLRLLGELADRPDPWLPLLVESGEGAPEARPISLGFSEDLDEVVSRGADPEAELPVLELRTVLRLVARARHDINNPLTAGLAEAQLLLMDLEDPELRESVELIREQLVRIRDLVADLQVLKEARPG